MEWLAISDERINLALAVSYFDMLFKSSALNTAVIQVFFLQVTSLLESVIPINFEFSQVNSSYNP